MLWAVFVTATQSIHLVRDGLGTCGDGICKSPEYAESCPLDCGELVRNPYLTSVDGGMPPYWKQVEGILPTFSEPTNTTQAAIRLESGAVIAHSSLSLVSPQLYAFSVHSDNPDCLEAYVHSASTVFASSVFSQFRPTASSGREESFITLKARCQVSISSVSLKPVPDSTNVGFRYGAIHDSIIGKPVGHISNEECKQMCQNNSLCCAWETCPGTEAEGCGGCYLLARAPEASAAETKDGWFAAIERPVPEPTQVSPEACRKFLLEQSSHEGDFYEKKLQRYNDCGNVLRVDNFVPKQIFIGGVHYPTIIVANHRTPEPRYRSSGDEFPVIPHFFALPFYDTNIGNVIKSTGAMNIVQSYEMQSMLKPGDVFIDVGANLGSYTVPLAEYLGPNGMVISFEPFRWLFQLLNANVALNGLMNVWSFQLALSEHPARQSILQPNVRSYSSPGGSRVANQVTGMSDETQKQMYDHEWGTESVDSWPLDEIIFGDDFFTGKNRKPRVSMIKIDVEGMEGDVIRGARRVIETFRPIVWSENVDYFEKNDTSFVELLGGLDYDCVKAQNAPNDLICRDRLGRFNL